MEALRSLARRHLTENVRKPVGFLAGKFTELVIRPLGGLLFDLKGGQFHADGCVFEIPKNVTTRTYRACFLVDDYERDERELIRKFIRPEDRVLEFGACMGIVSCITNRLLADRSAHVVVEGNPRLIPAIHRNSALNGCGFLVENCAGSNEREATFYLHPVYVVGGTTDRKSSVGVRVPGRSVAELTERYGPFTALIMDVEGSELSLLQADPSVLASYRLIIIELHPWAIGEDGVEKCRELFRAAGLSKVGETGITEAWERSAPAAA